METKTTKTGETKMTYQEANAAVDQINAKTCYAGQIDQDANGYSVRVMSTSSLTAEPFKIIRTAEEAASIT